MSIDRRTVVLGSLAVAFAAPVKAAPLSNFGLDAAHFGVRAGAQRPERSPCSALSMKPRNARVPLMLAPGVYRAGGLTLPAGAALPAYAAPQNLF